MRTLQQFIFIIILVVMTTTPSIAQYGVSHGEYCDEAIPCDAMAFLNCVNGTCQCLKPTEMVFDVNKAKCLVLLGNFCMFTSRLSVWLGLEKHEHSVECIDHASCSTLLRYCVCNSGFHENTTTGQCLPNIGYGRNCSNNTECVGMGENLICSNGTCSCNEAEAVYDKGRGECVAKVGVSCRKYFRCVPNAKNYFCGSRHSTAKCQCHDGYALSEEGLCLGHFNTECDPVSSPCIDSFSCFGGKCACPFPNYQEYHMDSGSCLSNLNGPCLETVGGKVVQFECAGAAECRNDTGVYECLCKNGYIQSGDNQCKKAYGTPCAEHDECHEAPGASLLCKGGICSCDDFQLYDEKLVKCFGLVGARCSEERECITNAYCKIESFNANAKYGICRCSPEAKVSSSRECVITLESGSVAANNNTNGAKIESSNRV